jgi:hypothetical protein
MPVARNDLYRSVTKAANLEGHEEEHVAEDSLIRNYLSSQFLSRQWQQYACFHLSVM